MNALDRYGPLVGRILLSLIFIISGFGKITGFSGTVGYIASKGLPAPALFAILAIVFELGGGLMLLTGWKARLGAAALFVFTALAALLFHNYWALPPEQAQNQMIHFMKNITIMGGLLYVVVYGPGPFSLGEDKRVIAA
jgi:putative oxidoreductase